VGDNPRQKENVMSNFSFKDKKYSGKKWRRSLMRLIIGLTGIVIIMVAAMVIPYWVMFHGTLSPDHLAWGSLGEYIGGILGPTFSLLTLVGVIYSLSADRHRISEENIITELRHMLDVLEMRLEAHKESIAHIMVDKYSKDNIQGLTDWSELSASFAFMSYCINELDQSAQTTVITAYYSAVYGKIVKQLYEKSAITADIYNPFRMHIVEPEDATSA